MNTTEEEWRVMLYSKEAVLHAVQCAIKGGRQGEEGLSMEERLASLVLSAQRDGVSVGMRRVQGAIVGALNLK